MIGSATRRSCRTNSDEQADAGPSISQKRRRPDDRRVSPDERQGHQQRDHRAGEQPGPDEVQASLRRPRDACESPVVGGDLSGQQRHDDQADRHVDQEQHPPGEVLNSRPPMFGPMIPPIGKIEVNSPSMRLRCSGNSRGDDRDGRLGMIPPPPSAWSTRQAIRM